MGGVSLYAKDIDSCAKSMVGYSRRKYKSVEDLNYDVTTYAKVWLLPWPFFVSNPIYYLSGMLAALVCRAVDIYATCKMAEQFENPKFFEYGLDRFYWEGSSVLGRHPTRKDLLSRKIIWNEAKFLIPSIVIPPYGYSLLTVSRNLYNDISLTAKSIEKAIEIGDEVKEKIDGGIPEEEIRGWLKDLTKGLAEVKR